MALVRVAYVSLARVSEDSLPVIVDVLAVSQRNNDRDGVTGALVASEGRYFQVVEGSRHAIDRLLARVSADSRHHSLHVVSDQTVDERHFAQWSMTAPKVTPHLAPRLKEAIDACADHPLTAIRMVRSLTAPGA